MIVCADVGNSATKIAAVSGERVLRVVTLPRGSSASAVESAIRRATRGAGDIAGCGLSSVRPRETARMRAALARACGCTPVVAGFRATLPVRIAVRRPAALGADRICAAAGAVGPRRRSVIVIDVGTAITVDLVTGGVFRGGVIMAGPTLSLQALHAHTAQLPAVFPSRGGFPPPGVDTTVAAMRWGAALSAAGGVRAAVTMLEGRAGRRLPRVVTGGAAGRLMALLGGGYRLKPHLTLLGLARIVRLSLDG